MWNYYLQSPPPHCGTCLLQMVMRSDAWGNCVPHPVHSSVCLLLVTCWHLIDRRGLLSSPPAPAQIRIGGSRSTQVMLAFWALPPVRPEVASPRGRRGGKGWQPIGEYTREQGRWVGLHPGCVGPDAQTFTTCSPLNGQHILNMCITLHTTLQ
jgi:hypothetical protein